LKIIYIESYLKFPLSLFFLLFLLLGSILFILWMQSELNEWSLRGLFYPINIFLFFIFFNHIFYFLFFSITLFIFF